MLWINTQLLLNPQQGFQPRCFVLSPKSDTPPEQVLHHYPVSAGAVRGDRHCERLACY